MTKADVIERDAQIEALRGELDHKQAEIDSRIAHATELEGLLETRAEYDTLIGQQLTEQDQRYQEDIGLAALVEVELAELVEDLFGQLHFAILAMSTAYHHPGEHPDALRAVISPVLDELAPRVDTAYETGSCQADNVRLTALLTAVSHQPDQSEPPEDAPTGLVLDLTTWHRHLDALLPS